MNKFLVEPTWEEIYFHFFPHLKKDTSFSSRDIIRFFEHNLTWHEQEQVKTYFKRFCVTDVPGPDPPSPISPPLLPPPLPPVIIFLPAPIPPSLPAPIPEVPPPPVSLPPWITSFWPFIFFPALSSEVLELLKEYIGVPELQAAVFQAESDAQYWKPQYYEEYGQYVTKGTLGGTRRPQTEEVEDILEQIKEDDDEEDVWEDEWDDDEEDVWEDEWDDFWDSDDDFGPEDDDEPEIGSGPSAHVLNLIDGILFDIQDLEYVGWHRLKEIWYHFKYHGEWFELPEGELYSLYELIE